MERLQLLLIFVLLAACANLQAPRSSSPTDVVEVNKLENPSLQDAFAVVELDEDVPEIETAPQKIGPAKKEIKLVKYNYKLLPKKPNRLTRKWIKYYSQKDRKRFQRFLNRGMKYKTVIQQLLVDHGLPPDLYFLAVLESGFKTDAISHAGAVGSWQFMRPTGRQYGLKIDYYVDERLDPMRSTVAAIKYLKELHRQFRSWNLAMAAYNAGPGRVRRAIRRGRSRNYWNLSNRRWLPRDTRHYVPQFLAILHIGSNPQKYGFHEKPSAIIPPIRLVNVPSPLRLKDISKTCKVSLEKLKKINPHLKKGLTPPQLKSYDIWVPKSQVVKFIAKKQGLKSKVVKGIKIKRYVAKRRRSRSRYHRVRRGQTLGSIARRYGRTVKYLKRLNRLKSSRIYVGQKLKVRGTTRVVAKRKKSKQIRYRIRRGDNLIKIAKRFRTTVRNIKRANRLRGNRIMKGQYLVIADNRR